MLTWSINVPIVKLICWWIKNWLVKTKKLLRMCCEESFEKAISVNARIVVKQFRRDSSNEIINLETV